MHDATECVCMFLCFVWFIKCIFGLHSEIAFVMWMRPSFSRSHSVCWMRPYVRCRLEKGALVFIIIISKILLKMPTDAFILFHSAQTYIQINELLVLLLVLGCSRFHVVCVSWIVLTLSLKFMFDIIIMTYAYTGWLAGRLAGPIPRHKQRRRTVLNEPVFFSFFFSFFLIFFICRFTHVDVSLWWEAVWVRARDAMWTVCIISLFRWDERMEKPTTTTVEYTCAFIFTEICVFRFFRASLLLSNIQKKVINLFFFDGDARRMQYSYSLVVDDCFLSHTYTDSKCAPVSSAHLPYYDDDDDDCIVVIQFNASRCVCRHGL